VGLFLVYAVLKTEKNYFFRFLIFGFIFQNRVTFWLWVRSLFGDKRLEKVGFGCERPVMVVWSRI
jgi:hypothetical protein